MEGRDRTGTSGVVRNQLGAQGQGEQEGIK